MARPSSQDAAERKLGILKILLVIISVCLATARPTAAESETAVVVLDTTGFWRMHHTLRPPVIQTPEGPAPLVANRRWLNHETPEPPEDWASTGFDDAGWVRGPAAMAIDSAYVARLCMRGKFRVTNLAEVRDLRLTLVYHGGAIVYVNGQELARAHLPDTGCPEDDSAEPYPREAYVSPDDTLLTFRNTTAAKQSAEILRRYDLRDRKFDNLAIPTAMLRQGVNVIGIELIRAPYHYVVEEKKGSQEYLSRQFKFDYDMSFNTCEFQRVQLGASSADGLIPNATRPEGLQVWNSDLMASDFDLDFGAPCESLQPIHVVGVRNGWFSGKVVVGSDRALTGLKAVASDLACGDVTIPAAEVEVRYGMPWGRENGVWGSIYGIEDNKYWRYPREPSLLGGLTEQPAAEYPVRNKEPSRYDLKLPNQPEPVPGAVVPVWVTIHVPKTALPGTYTGRLNVRADDEQPVNVPVEIEVVGWTLPDTQDYRTWIELVQSPDTLAVEYDVSLWSDQHWDHIGHAMELIGRTSSRSVYVPLIAQSNYGNAESMVRWIDKGEGNFEFDFSIMERYLDTAEKHMGRPELIVFVVWDVYLMRRDAHRSESSHDQEARTLRFLEGNNARIGGGPAVTVLDPVAQEVRNVELPRFDDPRSADLWRPLFAELRKRLEKRGLLGAAALGDMSDAWPTKQESLLLKDVSGDMGWVSFSHMGVPNLKLHDVASVVYQGHHVANRWPDMEQDLTSYHGWKRFDLRVQFNRMSSLDEYSPTRWRKFAEANIIGQQRGIGRLGGDFWPAVRDRRGRRRGTVTERYPHSQRRNLDIYVSLLAPGPGGPVATTRLEVFREGVQECEARICLEQALTDEQLAARLGPDLASRCQECLDERYMCLFKGMSTLRTSGPHHTHAVAWWYFSLVDGHTWYIGSGWQERSKKLYDLAAEVTKRLRDGKGNLE